MATFNSLKMAMLGPTFARCRPIAVGKGVLDGSWTALRRVCSMPTPDPVDMDKAIAKATR